MLFRFRLRSLREDHDLTLEDLAKRLHVTKTAIGNYETGYREPSLSTLIEIADYFNVTLDYLMGRSDENRPYK